MVLNANMYRTAACQEQQEATAHPCVLPPAPCCLTPAGWLPHHLPFNPTRRYPQDLPSRPRRNRRSETIRSAVRESIVSPSNFILPLFVHDEGPGNVPIPSMPGVFRLKFGKNVIDAVSEARSYGVNQVGI